MDLNILFLLTRLSRGVTVCVILGFRIFVFLLTRLSRGVTSGGNQAVTTQKFLLTRLSRGVTAVFVWIFKSYKISTHTPLARRDGSSS